MVMGVVMVVVVVTVWGGGGGVLFVFSERKTRGSLLTS